MHLLLHSVPPTLQQATTNSHLNRRFLDTHRQVWDILCGVTSFSWVLMPKVLLCPPRVYFPVLCKLWQFYGGVNGDLLQEGLCHTEVFCAQPYQSVLLPEPLPLWQATADPYLHRRHSNSFVSVSVGSLGLGRNKVCLDTLSVSGGNGV